MPSISPLIKVAASALLTLPLLAGCGDTGVTAPGTPAPNAAPAPGNNNPAGMDIAQLDAAEWTRQKCDLNAVNDTLVDFEAARGQPVVMRGFLVDEAGGVTPDFLLVLRRDDELHVTPAKTGVSRPDVAEFLSNPALESAGFEVTTDLSGAEPGAYRVYFVIQREDKAYFCEPDAGVVLR